MVRGRPKSPARRERILTAAARCFVRHGFHRASVQQICHESGMSPGALYRYFESKQAIIEAIAESERGDLASVQQELALTRDFPQTLDAIAMASLKLSADGDYARLAVEVVAEASRNRRVAEIIAATDRGLHASLVEAIERAQAAGQVDPALPARVSAEMLLAIFDGLTSRVLVDPSLDPTGLEPVLRVLLGRFLRVPSDRDGDRLA